MVEYYAPVANKQVELAVKEGGWVQCYGCCCYDKRDPLTKNWRELSVSKNLQKTKNGAIHVQCLMFENHEPFFLAWGLHHCGLFVCSSSPAAPCAMK